METHRPTGAPAAPPPAAGAGCPLCGGPLIDIRGKAVCRGCGRIAEGCCEGAPAACRRA